MSERRSTSSEDEDDSLDALLASARWPAMDAAATARLQRTLASTRRRSLARPVAWLAAAASIAVIVTVAAWRVRDAVVAHETVPAPRAGPLQWPGEGTGPSATHRATEVARPDAGRSVAVTPVLSREANAYERMMFAVLAAEDGRGVSTPVETVAPPLDLAAARRMVRTQLALPNGAIDLDAVRALAARGSTDAGDVAILMRCLRRPEARRPVLDAVAARDDRAGVDLLIRLVLDGATRGDALAAVRRSASPAVVDALIARLGASPRVDDRLAAARAVGATCDPRALDRLLGMVEADRSRREALAAILSCESPTARQLLARLRLDPAMAAQLAAVRAELDSLFS